MDRLGIPQSTLAEKMNYVRTICVALAAVCAAVSIQASQEAKAGAFEVASVKRNTASRVNSSITFSAGGRFSAQFQTVDRLIVNAYRIRNYQLSGLPGWASSERYDIEARANGNPNRDDMRLMVQRLLGERFQLKTHRETKEFAAYDLVTAKGGPKLKAAADRPTNGIDRQAGHLAATGTSMRDLAAQLSNMLDRPVADKTGVTGSFDFTLDYAEVVVRQDANPTPNEVVADIFTAIQEQLGLRLEASRASIEILVVDNIARPTEN